MSTLGLRAPHSNMMDADVRSLHRVPLCRLYNTVGEAGHGPGAANIGWSAASYDTDSMSFQPGIGSFGITCRTTGLYWCAAHAQFSGVAGLFNIWPRIIINNNAAAYVSGSTDQRANMNTFGGWFETRGIWNAKKGDFISLYVYTSAAINIEGPSDEWHLWMSAHWIGST